MRSTKADVISTNKPKPSSHFLLFSLRRWLKTKQNCYRWQKSSFHLRYRKDLSATMFFLILWGGFELLFKRDFGSLLISYVYSGGIVSCSNWYISNIQIIFWDYPSFLCDMIGKSAAEQEELNKKILSTKNYFFRILKLFRKYLWEFLFHSL